MSRRAVARKETRRRIVEATVKLHGEKGIFGTSWRDIANEADVSVATVYSHFPSLDQLLPACGQFVMEHARPPSLDAASEVVGDADDLRERLMRVAHELFGFYERGGPHLEIDAREREIAGVREWEESQRATVVAFVREALAHRAGVRKARLVSAFFDLPTYKALRTRGVSPNRAAETVADIAACLVERDESSTRRTEVPMDTARAKNRLEAEEPVLKPAFVPSHEGEARWWGGGLAVLKATAADTAGQMTIVEVTEPPGTEAPLHVHHKEDEAFWVLDGDVTLQIGETTIEAHAGDYAFGPRHIPHRYTVGPAGCRMLFILTPGGFEDLVMAMSEPADARTLPPPSSEEPDMAQIKAIAEAHGGEVLDG